MWAYLYLRCYFWYQQKSNCERQCTQPLPTVCEARSVATCMACVYYVTAYLAPDGLGNTSHTRAWWVELLLHASLSSAQHNAGWQQVIFVAAWHGIFPIYIPHQKYFMQYSRFFFYYQVLQCLGHLPVLIYYYSPSISVFLFSNLRSLFVWAILRVQASFGLPHFFRPLGIYSYVFFNLIHRFKPI